MVPIAIVGAAGLGRRLACAALLAGYRTVLEDISPSALEEGIAWIAQAFGDNVARGKMNAAQLAMLEKQFLDRHLLESANLPRLSLFYL